MKQIAQVLLFDRHGRLLIYLRDEKPNIPFPNHWDFFGGPHLGRFHRCGIVAASCG